MELTSREIKILESFVTYPLLTRKQVTKLHYSNGSYQGVNDVLGAMVNKGLLSRPARPTPIDPYFYMPGKKGVRVLREMGYEIAFHPSEHAYPSRITMEHTISVTDTMIAISGVSQVSEKYTVFEMLHDVALKRQKTERVRADIITRLRTDTAKVALFWEVDRGTEAQAKIRKKIRDCLLYFTCEYEKPDNTEAITVLFLTTREQGRFTNMLRWVETELQESYQEKNSDLFRLATQPQELTAPNLFFEPIWRIPGREEMYRLFG